MSPPAAIIAALVAVQGLLSEHATSAQARDSIDNWTLAARHEAVERARSWAEGAIR